jgi:hypothetical protein
MRPMTKILLAAAAMLAGCVLVTSGPSGTEADLIGPAEAIDSLDGRMEEAPPDGRPTR